MSTRAILYSCGIHTSIFLESVSRSKRSPHPLQNRCSGLISDCGETCPLTGPLLCPQESLTPKRDWHAPLRSPLGLHALPHSSFSKHFIYLFIFWPCHTACGILVPWSGIEPLSPAVEVQSFNHWTAREVPTTFVLKIPILTRFSLNFLVCLKQWENLGQEAKASQITPQRWYPIYLNKL